MRGWVEEDVPISSPLFRAHWTNSPPPHFRIDPGNVVHCNVLLVCVDAFEDLGVSGTVKTEWILANWYQKN